MPHTRIKKFALKKNPPAVEREHVRNPARHIVEMMRYQQHTDAAAYEIFQCAREIGARRSVESIERLVENDETRVMNDGASEKDFSAFAV